ncbi:jg19471 [Pararge aegeria aegeria]|uniref:Jg19471 protein n=2 Tax=Pararge aegeria TaxID=116150 RepID=A0A8S4R6J9_9NEOP|nr:jg19471 [Pararge aegeria aegeria]
MDNTELKMYKIEELLESDDELPMDYYEVPATPAYQIESRFDAIQFKWINPTKTLASKIESSYSLKENKLSHLDQQHPMPILKKGVMNKHDLFCIKSIEDLAGDATLIWLINFLLYKDIQANYLFLKSCLVSCK